MAGVFFINGPLFLLRVDFKNDNKKLKSILDKIIQMQTYINYMFICVYSVI